VAQSVEALRYKSEGRGFDFRWCPSGRTMVVGLTQPLTEMSTRNISGGLRRPVRRDDNSTTFIRRLSRNLGASNFWNSLGLSRPVMGLIFTYKYSGIDNADSTYLLTSNTFDTKSGIQPAFLGSTSGETPCSYIYCDSFKPALSI
jgi:hypothetical protein